MENHVKKRYFSKGGYPMTDFFRGMSTIGVLYPAINPPPAPPSLNSAWEGVANSFFQAGNDLRTAMDNFPHEQKTKQPTV
jgi:hypothetical protein